MPGGDNKHAVIPATGRKLAAPNPQGKGQVGFLLDWHYSAPKSVAKKSPAQVLADYFTSLLVLSADFKFKPVFATDYYLYYADAKWSLSLLSPENWNRADKRRAFVGTCVLHDDATWTIEPSENLSTPGDVADAIAEFYSAFVDKLDTQQTLESELPFFEGRLPYYQRLFASALSRSLRLSMIYGGQTEIGGRDWLAQLPRQATGLLATGPTNPDERA